MALATLFITVRLETVSEIKSTELGYPVSFLQQDFSAKYGNNYFFPTWEEFSFSKKYSVVGFSAPGLAVDFIVALIVCEILFYLLEAVDFALRKERG